MIVLASIDLVGLACLLIAGLVLAWLSLAFYIRFMLTRPPRRGEGWAVVRSLPSTPSELTPALTFESWNFRGSTVWDVAGENASGPITIITHGWGESRVHGLFRLPAIASVSSRVIIWDMPGHGDAPGTCSLGVREPALLRELIDQVARDVPVVLYGSSLGAGVSIASAIENPRVKGVIAEAPYRLPPTPAHNMMFIRGLPNLGALRAAQISIHGLAWLRAGGPFDRAALAAKLACPLTIIHGQLDAVCPLDDARAIAQAGRGELHVIDGAGHLDLWTEKRWKDQVAQITQQAIARQS
jgi:pimeloyl-ACP methyl ester carboxylesterase